MHHETCCRQFRFDCYPPTAVSMKSLVYLLLVHMQVVRTWHLQCYFCGFFLSINCLTDFYIFAKIVGSRNKISFIFKWVINNGINWVRTLWTAYSLLIPSNSIQRGNWTTLPCASYFLLLCDRLMNRSMSNNNLSQF